MAKSIQVPLREKLSLAFTLIEDTIYVLTAELPKMVKENEAIFYNAMIELGLLTVLIVALVVSLRLIRPSDPNAAAEDKSTPTKRGA
jgi:hypothetical protein